MYKPMCYTSQDTGAHADIPGNYTSTLIYMSKVDKNSQDITPTSEEKKHKKLKMIGKNKASKNLKSN